MKPWQYPVTEHPLVRVYTKWGPISTHTMALPVSNLKSHRNIVYNVYRCMMRNAVHLTTIDTTLQSKLIQKIRGRFRSNTSVPNSISIQKLLLAAKDVNDKIVDAYDETKKEPLLSLLSPIKPLRQQQPVRPESRLISKRIRKNPLYSNLTDDEIREFRETRETSIPESAKYLLSNINIHADWYFKSNDFPKMKGKLDNRYLRNILASAIAYSKQSYYLNKLDKKLKGPPTHKLRRISGTGNYIYVIKTPWNRDLRTEDFKFIGDVRRRYDQLVINLQESESYRQKFEFVAKEETKWEALLGEKTRDDWTWLFETSERELHREKQALEDSVLEFCKRQGLIYEKIKPVFDQMQSHSVSNIKILNQDIELNRMGPYTDVVDHGLGSALKKYGFKDPLEVKYRKSLCR